MSEPKKELLNKSKYILYLRFFKVATLCISINSCALLNVNLWNLLMHLSQSVVLWQIALFDKRPSPYYGKNSSNKQRETTVHHYFKTRRSVNVEHFKKFEHFFKCSRKNYQELWQNGSYEDRHRKGRPTVTSAAEELTAPKIAAQINASQSSSKRHISTSTVQRRLHDRIAAKKPLVNDTNKKKRLAWAKKHDQWTLDRWKSVLWSDESKFDIFGSNSRVFVRRRVGERRISACVVHEAWRRRCDGVLLVTLSVIFFEFKEHLTSRLPQHSAAIRHPI